MAFSPWWTEDRGGGVRAVAPPERNSRSVKACRDQGETERRRWRCSPAVEEGSRGVEMVRQQWTVTAATGVCGGVEWGWEFGGQNRCWGEWRGLQCLYIGRATTWMTGRSAVTAIGVLLHCFGYFMEEEGIRRWFTSGEEGKEPGRRFASKWRRLPGAWLAVRGEDSGGGQLFWFQGRRSWMCFGWASGLKCCWAGAARREGRDR
jgi:hypothetical protein